MGMGAMDMHMGMTLEQQNMHDGIHLTEHSFHPVHIFKPKFFKKPIPVIYKPIIKTVKVPVKVSFLMVKTPLFYKTVLLRFLFLCRTR